MAIQKRNDELVNLLSADFLRKQYPLTATDGRFGGMIEMTIELENSTTITIIDADLFDPVDILHYDIDVAADSGISKSTFGTLAQNESINLFDVSGETVQLRMTADGDVELQRTAGTLSYAIVLRLRWMFDVYTITSKYFKIIADQLVGFHTTRLSVPTGESHTIDSGYQLLVHGHFTIDGTLVDNGELVIL